MKTMILSALLASAFMVAPLSARADNKEETDALAKAKITLIEAIQAAEKHTAGKAFDASLDDDSFRSEYEVNVVKDGTVYDVRIDGENGEVLGSREDRD